MKFKHHCKWAWYSGYETNTGLIVWDGRFGGRVASVIMCTSGMLIIDAYMYMYHSTHCLWLARKMCR